MREHKYRGKCIDSGELVYGYYVLDYGKNQHLIISNTVGAYNAGFKPKRDDYCISDFIVIPETVSEFTGLRDKNSVEVYENDTLKNSRGHFFRVIWEDWGWVLQRLNVPSEYGQPVFTRGTLRYLEKVDLVEGMILLEDPNQLKMFEEVSE